MDANPEILAINLDLARIEAALVDSAGQICHVEWVKMPPARMPDGRAGFSGEDLLEATVDAVRALTERKPREARRIAALGIIGRSPSAALVGEDSPKATFVSAFARQAVAAREKLHIDEGLFRAVTGLCPRGMELAGIFAALSDAGRGKILTPKDYLKWALTGEFTTDALDAQRTLLLDIESRQWSRELAGALQINPDRLAEIAPAESAAGVLTADAAEALHLPAGLPVSCGLGDWGEYIGSGAWSEGDAFEHIGTTGAFYGVSASRPSRDEDLDVRPHIMPGLYLAGRERLPGGAALEWLLAKSHFSRDGVIDWAHLDEELDAIAAVGTPANMLFFARLEDGEDAVNRAACLDLHADDSLTSIIQGVLEGIFFELKAVACRMESLPWRTRAVYTTGRVGFKHGPRRMRAHIYGAPVHAGRRPGANILSAALAGAVAGGVHSTLEAARSSMLDIGGGAAPEDAAALLYEEQFAKWLGMRGFLSDMTPCR